LRRGSNPFAIQVTTAGAAVESVLADVPEYAGSQLSALCDIIKSYRAGRPATRVYPLAGDRGTGKTHLLHVLAETLRRRARECGDETLVVVVERLSTGNGSTDYLLWQVVNHLLAAKGGFVSASTVASRGSTSPPSSPSS
jgi:hypothetical protein